MLSALSQGEIYRQSLYCLPGAFVLVEILNNQKSSGQIIDLNDKACDLLHYERQELLSAHSDANPVAHFFCLNRKNASEFNVKRKFLLKTNLNHCIYIELVSNTFTVDGRMYCFHSFNEIDGPLNLTNDEAQMQNGNRFRTLVDSMDDLVFTVDKNMKFSGVFGKWFEMNKVPKENLLHKRLHQLNLSDKVKEIHRRAFEQAFAGEKIVYSWTFGTQEQPIYFQTSLSPLLTSGREVKELVGVTRNITNLKNKETLLKELNQQNEAILSSTADGILVINQMNRIVYANDKAMEMLSPEGESPIGKLFRNILKNLIHEDILKEKKEFQNNEIFETECILANGKNVFYQFLGNEMKEGNSRKGYVISVRDVTYKKETEARQKRFYEAVSSGIIVINKEGKIHFLNQNALEILGYNSVELTGLHDLSKDWRALDESGNPLQLCDHPIMRAFATGENIRNFILGTYNPKKREHRWLMIDATVIFENDDRRNPIEYVISTFTDITEHVELKKRMDKSEKLAVIGRLAAVVAHEIRNPLTSINGFLKLISPTVTGKATAYLDILRDEVDRINRVTSEFLVLAKTQEEKRETLSLQKDILEPVMKMFSQHVKNNEIVFILNDRIPNKLCVSGIKNQLIQLIEKLIENSIEAMPAGGKIQLNVIEGIDSLKIVITDEGYGIPAERLKYIGEPFYSLKEKGTGLGITICNKIIRDHGGELSISSEENKGTTVEITLPKV